MGGIERALDGGSPDYRNRPELIPFRITNHTQLEHTIKFPGIYSLILVT